MAAIYQNAWLTLSADGVADPRYGLFGPVSKRKYWSVQLYLTKLGLNPGPVYHAPRTDLYCFEITNRVYCINDNRRAYEPLRRRCWAFQKWILFRRIIHFYTDELIWECHETETCEC